MEIKAKKLFRADDRGAVMLEFVLTFILFVAVMVGMANISLVLRDRLAVAAAARETGRTYAVTTNVGEALKAGNSILAAAGISSSRGWIEVRPEKPGHNQDIGGLHQETKEDFRHLDGKLDKRRVVGKKHILRDVNRHGSHRSCHHS